MKSKTIFIAETVDRILEDEDENDDGYLSYVEYADSRRATRMLKHAAKNVDSRLWFFYTVITMYNTYNKPFNNTTQCLVFDMNKTAVWILVHT